MSRPKTSVTLCHPERPHSGRGLCQKCYSANYAKKNKEWIAEKDKARSRREHDPEYKNKKYYSLIKRKYGLSEDTYKQMLESQNAKCKICRLSPAKGKRLHVDHCHKTGKVRGLLCAQCNWFAGKLDNLPRVLMRLFIYERNWTEV